MYIIYFRLQKYEKTPTTQQPFQTNFQKTSQKLPQVNFWSSECQHACMIG